MGSKGGNNELVSEGDQAESSEATVEIKIKTLDSQTYILRVDRCVPVPALKEQIATVTGVLSEQQRLICRGKVLKDDQLLSAYHVEDGHTLHLVVRQPIPPSSETFPDQPDADSTSSGRHAQGNHHDPGVLVGTFNISEQGDGAFPDLSRIISAVISPLGITNVGGGSEAVELGEPSIGSVSRPFSIGGLRSISTQQAAQAGSGFQSNSHSGASLPPTAVPLNPLQPLVIPDSLSTLSQYLSHLREEFRSSVRGQSNNSQAADAPSTQGQDLDAASQSVEHGGLPTPASLAEVILSTRQMLSEQAGECLLQLARQMQDHANVTDSLARTRIQSDAISSGGLLQNLGSLLLELGRTTMTLRIGQTPADAIVNAGPAVFISTSGPNPIMVQPLPFQPGTNFGAIPVGTVQPGSGLSGGSVGSGFLPRNIDIRIRAGSLMPSAVVNQREPTGAQPGGQTDPTASVSGNPANQGTGEVTGSPPSARDSEVRLVPIRTTVVAVPASLGRAVSDSSHNSSGVFYPVIARVQQVTSVNLNRRRDSSVSDEGHNRQDAESGQQPIRISGVQENSRVPGADGNTQSVGETTNSQGFSQVPSGLDQLLRTIFSGEQIDGTGTNFQEVAADSSTRHEGTTQLVDTRTQEAMPVEVDEGTFLSHLLHQIMPLISQNATTGSDDTYANVADNPVNRSSLVPSTQAQESSDREASSPQPENPASPPEPKRQRRE